MVRLHFPSHHSEKIHGICMTHILASRQGWAPEKRQHGPTLFFTPGYPRKCKCELSLGLFMGLSPHSKYTMWIFLNILRALDVLKTFGLRRNLPFLKEGRLKNNNSKSHSMFAMKSCPTDNKDFSVMRTFPWITLIFYASGQFLSYDGPCCT